MARGGAERMESNGAGAIPHRALGFRLVLGQASEALLRCRLWERGNSFPGHGLPIPASSQGYLTSDGALQGWQHRGGQTQHPIAAVLALLALLHRSPPPAPTCRRNTEQHSPFPFPSPSSGLRDSWEWCGLGWRAELSKQTSGERGKSLPRTSPR